ncbi:MAG: phosphoenolpyruvate hydrolase family protein [Sciscionella sp.]
MDRTVILERLRSEVAQGRPVIGAGAGTGLSAKCAEIGGADLLIIYNSGRYRMAGRGSAAGLLPYGDANAIVMEMSAEVLPVVRDTPVLAGVCGTDPFRDMRILLEEIRRIGFSGVQNFPTVGLFEGRIRANLEETGMGFDREVEMIRLAHEMDLFTSPYAFTRQEGKDLAGAGADLVVAHVGTSSSGLIGAESVMSLDEAVQRVAEIEAATHAANPEVMVLCHGGPIVGADEAARVIRAVPGVVGFYGASSMERIPVEKAITEHVAGFKKIPFHTR